MTGTVCETSMVHLDIINAGRTLNSIDRAKTIS